jgi:peroxiredoxin
MSGHSLIRCFCCLMVCIFLCLSGYPADGSEEKGATGTISVGKDLPQFKLKAPRSDKDKQYLGLKNSKDFSLSEIPAKLIVFEIFSVYCPHCKKNAGQLNKLYNLIQQDPELSQATKMIAMSTGTREDKTDKWKETLEVPFPLFSDPYSKVFKEFGSPPVPVTFVATNSGKVLYTHGGVIENEEDLFRFLKESLKEQ